MSDDHSPVWSDASYLEHRYMLGRCLDLASALSRRTGLPIAGLRRHNGGLPHAFLVLNSEEPPRRWRCLDWMGERSLQDIRDDLANGWGQVVLDPRIEPVQLQLADSDETILEHAATRDHLRALLEDLDSPGPEDICPQP